ncbi:MAG: dihydroorotate dehydrogenase [Candidatus Hydrothermarchaeota archaeon]
MLDTELCGLSLRNPLILASGILGETGSSLLRVYESGAGAITTKSISIEPKVGNPNPVICEVSGGLLNCIGLSNPGYKEYIEELKILKEKNIPLIVSIFGKNPEEFGKLSSLLEEYASIIELNVSCPHERIGLIGKDPEMINEVVKSVKKSISKPVFVKLTPNVNDIVEIALECEKAGADGVVAINTLGPGMAIDVDSLKPILSNRFGGLSGPCIKPIAVRCVYEIYEAVEIPIIGVGGILNARDVVEFMLAGASCVGIGSGIYYKGLEIFSKISKELEEYMEEKGFKSPKEMVGLAHD